MCSCDVVRDGTVQRVLVPSRRRPRVPEPVKETAGVGADWLTGCLVSVMEGPAGGIAFL